MDKGIKSPDYVTELAKDIPSHQAIYSLPTSILDGISIAFYALTPRH